MWLRTMAETGVIRKRVETQLWGEKGKGMPARENWLREGVPGLVAGDGVATCRMDCHDTPCPFPGW